MSNAPRNGFRSIKTAKAVDDAIAAITAADGELAKSIALRDWTVKIVRDYDDGSFPCDDLFMCAVDGGGVSPSLAKTVMEKGIELARGPFAQAPPIQAAMPEPPPGFFDDAPNGTVGQDAEGTLRQKSESTSVGLKIKFFDDLDKPTPKPWEIKGVLARGETSSWIGPPGCGKSTLLTDITFHKGANLDWRGYKTKGAGAVAYFALERAPLVERRLLAYKLRHDLKNLPIAAIGEIIDLMDRGCVNLILDAIKRVEDRYGIKAALAVFDTYSKGIAAGGGEENSAKDQNIVLANLRRVIDQCDLHIATVGHTGKDTAKGERGSNAKQADVDVEVQISGDIVKTVTVTKANDQEPGPLTSFRLDRYELGLDEEGEPYGTYIVSEEILRAEVGDAKKPLSDKQVLAKQAAIEVMLSSNARPASPDYGLPKGTKVADLELLYREMERNGAVDLDKGNPRDRRIKLRDALKLKGVIGFRDKVFWMPKKDDRHDRSEP
jgi:hypothetical protein